MINSIIVSIVGFFGNNFNDVVSALIVILAAFWFWRYDINILSKIKRSLRRINDEINTITGYEIDNIKKIDKLIDREGHQVIKEIWADYYDDFMNLMNKEKSPDIKEYFSISSTVVMPAARKKTEVLPGILVATGVLGTFLGLAAGLRHLDISTNITMQEGMNALLGGISTAFSTCIVAIVLSILFQILDRHLYHNTVKEVYTFHSLVERKVPIASDTQYLELLVREQQVQTACLQEMGSNIAAHLNGFISHDLIPSMNKTFEDSVKTHIAPSVSTISEMIYQLSQVALQNQTEGIQKMVDSFIERLNSSLNDQFKSFGNTLQELSEYCLKTKENLDYLIKELSQSTTNQKEINETCESIIGAIAQYNLQILESGKKLSETLEKANELISDVSETTESNSELLDRLNRQHLQFADEIEETFSKFAETAAKTVSSMESDISSQVKSMSTLAEKIALRVDELNQNLSKSVKEFNEQMHSGITKTFSDFDEGLSEICKRFSSTITEIKDAIDDLPAVIESFKGNASA